MHFDGIRADSLRMLFVTNHDHNSWEGIEFEKFGDVLEAAVVLTFVHLPPAIRGLAHRRLAQALRPGGCLILEAFHPRQLAFTSGGPKAEDMLYTLDLLRRDFAGLLAEVEAREGEVSLNEGPGHQGPGFVTRWVGQRLG